MLTWDSEAGEGERTTLRLRGGESREAPPCAETDDDWLTDLFLARLELLLLLQGERLAAAPRVTVGVGKGERFLTALRQERRQLIEAQVRAVERELCPFLPRYPLAVRVEQELGVERWDAITMAHLMRADAADRALPLDRLVSRIGELHARVLTFLSSKNPFSVEVASAAGLSPLLLAILVAVLRKGNEGRGSPSWIELEQDVVRVLLALEEEGASGRVPA